MKLIKSNVEQMPVKAMPEMWCFGGCNVAIETDKIKSVEQAYYQDYATMNYTPVLVFTLQDGTKITVDYENEQDAKDALKVYKKEFLWRR